MATGAVDPALDLRLTSPNLGRTKVEDLAVSPDGTRLVAIGALEYAQGVRRDQLVVADTAANPVRPADWYTTAYAADCRDNFDTYLRGVDFAPDGSYSVDVTAGRLVGGGRTGDTAARFNVAGAGAEGPARVSDAGDNTL